MADLPEPLVSDADRDDVVERLRAACGEGRLSLDEFADRVGDVYRARTAADLVPLTADLPVPAPAPAEPEPPAVERVVGVFGSAHRSGPWRPADPTDAVAVLGACQLDLTAVDLAAETHIRATAVLGGVEVLVPEGVDVDLGGFAVLGSRDDRTRRSRVPGAPVVRVECRAVLGGVTVRTHRFRSR